MRIIAGEFKGRRLKAPRWDGVRPTSDKLRETLFNVVAPRVPARVCSTCLPAPAPSGSRASAAAPRGQCSSSRIAAPAALIEENAALCGVSDRCAIIRGAAERRVAGRASTAIHSIWSCSIRRTISSRWLR